MRLKDKRSEQGEKEPGFVPEHVVDSSSLISKMEVLQPMSSVFPILMNFKVGRKLLRQTKEAQLGRIRNTLLILLSPTHIYVHKTPLFILNSTHIKQ